MKFDPGFPITPTAEPLGFKYGPGVFGPSPELRSLDSIRDSLRDREASGPDPVYAIAMDVGMIRDRVELERRMLLFGVVTYAAGSLAGEVVRSQGHIHKVSTHSGWSPPEVYEIWSGAAFIYMQEFAADDPGSCYAIHAGPGEKVIVPPGWAHATLSADHTQAVTFGALCDREYGFEYTEIRKRRGLAWYALVDSNGEIKWEANPLYQKSELIVRGPGEYRSFGLARSVPLYSQLERDFDRFQWVSKPGILEPFWRNFQP